MRISSNVTTKSEFNDKTLKIACLSGTTDSMGYLELMIKVPGTFNGTEGEKAPTSNGRYLEYGEAWFNNPVPGDKVTGIHVLDQDRLIAASVGASLQLGRSATDEEIQAGFEQYGIKAIPTYPLVGSYTDDELPADKQGWFLKTDHSTMVTAASGPGFVPSGFYVRVRIQKGATAPKNENNEYIADTFFANFKWSKNE
jgi:hypothetical protein